MRDLEAAALEPSELVEALRVGAQNDKRVEAAIELLVRHDVWLRRPAFLATCVQVDRGVDGAGRLSAAIDWHKAARLAERVATTTTDRRVLRVAAALGGDKRRVDIVTREGRRRGLDRQADGPGVGTESVEHSQGVSDGRPG